FGAVAPERSLVLVHTPHVLAMSDLNTIALHVREIAPTIATLVVSNTSLNSAAREKAAELLSLIFSPVRLKNFVPIRGKVYQGRAIAKLEQLRRLAAAGVSVPRTAVLTPTLTLDPSKWGRFVILKPTYLAGSSRGKGIQLMRMERVRYIAPLDYP